MTGPLDEIRPAIDFGALFWIRLECLSIHKKELPEAEPPPDIVGESQFMRGRRVLYRRQRVEIGLEVDEVL
jgi:hypothetical protein